MKTAGVVLAAGASSRMGTNKALLRVGERTFLDALGGALRAGGCDPVLAVVADPVAVIRNGCRLSGIALVVNPEPSRGQISSLRCALHALPGARGAIVLLVDQGWIEAETVRAVGAALRAAPLAQARYDGRAGHPVGFLQEIFGELLSEAADSGARAVFAAQTERGRVRFVDVDDPGVTRNLNTPEDYQAFLRRFAGHPLAGVDRE